jgi:hypothetical protein
MAEITKRKMLGFLSFIASILVAWLTGATSSAKASNQALTDSVKNTPWQLSSARQIFSRSTLLPFDESFDPAANGSKLENPGGKPITIAAYESESPSAKAGSGQEPVRPFLFIPKREGGPTTIARERATLERFLNTRVRVKKTCERCQQRVKSGLDPVKCITEVLKDLEDRLAREAQNGSAVAQSALPIVREMVVKVEQAESGEAALEAVREGLSKVQRIQIVRSQDTVISNLQQQQRAVLTETIEAVEVNLASMISI